MKNIDELLEQTSAPEPRRDLRPNFAASIVADLKAQPTASRKEPLFMRIVHKPALLVLALALTFVLGGTAYAGTDGFTKPFDFKNIFGYSVTTQDDGSRVVRIATSDCDSASFVDGNDELSLDAELYLRTKPESTISLDNVLQYAQGYCENISNRIAMQNIVATIVREQKLETAMTTLIGKIVSIDANSLEVVYDVYASVDDPTVFEQESVTANFGNDTIVTRVYKPSRPSELMVGDTIHAYAKSNLVGEGQIDYELRYINVQSDAESLFLSLQSDLATELERVISCSENQSRFCSWEHEVKKDYDTSSLTAIEAEASMFVKNAYEPYFEGGNPPGYDGSGNEVDQYTAVLSRRKAFIEEHTTEDLAYAIEQTQGIDPIVCSMNAPRNPRFSRPLSFAGNQVIVLINNFNGEDEALAEITYNPVLKKISSITCVSELRLR